MSDAHKQDSPSSRRIWLRLLVAGSLIAATLGVADYLIIREAKQVILLESREHLKALALLAAQRIDGDDLAEIDGTEDMNTPEFIQVHKTLMRIRSAHRDIQYVYILRYSGKGDLWHFVVDADSYDVDKDGDGEISELEKGTLPGQKYEAGVFQDTMKAGLKRSSADMIPVPDHWGVFVSGYAPIFDSSGKPVAILGIDIRWQQVITKQDTVAYSVIGMTVLVGFLLVYAFYLFLRRTEAWEEVVYLQKQLQEVKGQFAKFVPDNVRRELERNPDAVDLQRREKDVTIMFADLGGYTAMSERMAGESVGFVVERYFSRYLEVIHEYRGQVNETAGDGLMIIFEEESEEGHAIDAVRAAVAILKVTDELNAAVEANAAEAGASGSGDPDLSSGELPAIDPIKVNIGINSGIAWVGLNRFQSISGDRYTYTATGSTTNLAARIAVLAKDGDVLVSAETARRVENELELIDLGKHSFKNVSKPVRVFRPQAVQDRREGEGVRDELT